MNIDPLEFEDSLQFLSKKQQAALISSLSIVANAKDSFYDGSLKTLVNVITSAIPLKNFIKYNYGSDEQGKDLDNLFRYFYYPNNTILYESKSESLGEFFYVLIAGKVELSKNSKSFSLTHLMLQMKKYNLRTVFTRLTGRAFDLTALPETQDEEFELLDLLVDKLKTLYANHDNYNLLELNEYRKTPRIIFHKPGECWGIEEIMNKAKKNVEDFSIKTISNVHLLKIERYLLMTILGNNITKSIKERQKFIMNLCPNVFKSSCARQILRKVRYIYPLKGEKIYLEDNLGNYIYLILKGNCLLKKTVYIDIMKKFSTTRTKFKQHMNYNVPLKAKSFDNIILDKGSFAGIEIFFQDTTKYQYTLEVADDYTLLCEFHYLDFIQSDLIEPMKLFIKQTYSIQEKHMKSKLTTLNEKALFVDYRNLTKSEYLIKTYPEIIAYNCMSKMDKEAPMIKAQLVRNISVVNLPSRNLSRRESILMKDNSFSKKKKMMLNNNRIFSNNHLNTFVTSLLSGHTLMNNKTNNIMKEEEKENRKLEEARKILFQKKLSKVQLNKRNPYKGKTHYSNGDNLINSLDDSKSDVNSQIIFSIKNYNNSLQKDNYVTRTMKIPLVTNILSKSPNVSSYTHKFHIN